MEELKHFSHDHPLILIQILEDDNSDESGCYGCGGKILQAEPTYNCHECNIFLHKRCAELPMEMIDPLHAQHPLKLVAQPPSRWIRCHICSWYCTKFTYYCVHCKLGLHILCSAGSILDHPSHEHPLTIMRAQAKFECNACGDTEKRDLSYVCIHCSFWIHKSCASLQRIYERKDHPHSLSLAYSFPMQYRKYEIPCDVCSTDVLPRNWVYYCGPCRYFVHLPCITKSIQTKWKYSEYYRMQVWDPSISKQPEVTLPPTNFIRLIQDVMEKQHKKEIQQFSEMKIESHEHPLIFLHLNNDRNSINQEILYCHRCTEPIISSCYHCTQCKYSIHLTCSQLPKELEHPIHQSHILHLTFHPNIWDTIKCTLCKFHCNGAFYQCSDCVFDLDIKCALLPSRIKHKAHERRLMLSVPIDQVKCDGCGISVSILEVTFICDKHCNFNLCYGCASLPPSVKHRWDKHELLLRFPPFSDQPDEFYCEICEEEIHPKHWQYRCGECDLSFHPKCVAESRNIIFGQTVKVSEHQHPITSVPEGDLHSCCNSCHVYLYSKRAFKCASCQYYKCFDCMRP